MCLVVDMLHRTFTASGTTCRMCCPIIGGIILFSLITNGNQFDSLPIMRVVPTNIRLAKILDSQQEIMASAGEVPGAFRKRFTLAEIDAVYAASDGHCAICRCIPKGKLALDHDHKTGKLRGLLCVLCNTALGKFKDDPDILMRAIEYLKR